MNQDRKKYIFDTSALLTFIENENGFEDIENYLIRAEKNEIGVYISFISLVELFYITLREKDEAEASYRVKLIQSLAVHIVESYENVHLTAARLKAKNRISLADSLVAALCKEYDGILVHKDPEFEQLSSVIVEHRLPYKSSSD